MNTDITQLVRNHPFTQGFWPDQVARLTAMAAELRFEPGDLIFCEGDQSSLFYLLISGNVALEIVTAARPVRVDSLFAGEVLGWSSVTLDTGKQFQARAIEEVHVLEFDGARLRHAFEEDYAFGFWFMRSLLTVMSGRLQAIRAQLIDLCSPLAVGEK